MGLAHFRGCYVHHIKWTTDSILPTLAFIFKQHTRIGAKLKVKLCKQTYYDMPTITQRPFVEGNY